MPATSLNVETSYASFRVHLQGLQGSLCYVCKGSAVVARSPDVSAGLPPSMSPPSTASSQHKKGRSKSHMGFRVEV